MKLIHVCLWWHQAWNICVLQFSKYRSESMFHLENPSEIIKYFSTFGSILIKKMFCLKGLREYFKNFWFLKQSKL